jgi:pimeloyl-ACP methyl ester carboxylesterase
VKGLALLGTSARPEADAMRQLREAAIGFFEQGRAAEVLQLNLPLAFHPSRSDDKALAQAYLDMILAAGSDQLVRQNRAVMARPDALTHLPRLRCPVLAVCGDGDQLTPPECSREITAAVPGSQLVVVARCGHMLTMERPEAVNRALNAWLSRLLGL